MALAICIGIGDRSPSKKAAPYRVPDVLRRTISTSNGQATSQGGAYESTSAGAIDLVRPLSDYRHQAGPETLWLERPLNKAVKSNLRSGKCILTPIASSQREGHSCGAE